MVRPALVLPLLLSGMTASSRAESHGGAPPVRQRLSLDGGGWHMQLDPSDPKVATMAANGSKVAGPISVPGAWCAQGFGEETAQLHSQYSGVGFYSRLVTVPPALLPQSDSTLWLVVERPHRTISVSVGGTFVGNHTGYLSSFETDITRHAAASLNVSLAVNTKAGPGDGMEGTMDLVLDGVSIGGWGGIGGHIYLEARGKAWIEAPHVQHTVASSYDSASVNVSVTVGGGLAAPAVALRVVYVDPHNRTVGQAHTACTKAAHCSVPDVTLSHAPLWSPSSPAQHTAFLELSSSDGSIVYDREVIQFGLRRLEVDGVHWKLNGRWLYLHGYGDDSIYPATVAPPVNYSFCKYQRAIEPATHSRTACRRGR